MIKIYHNPRCSKSREGMSILKDSGEDFQVIKYLEDVPTKKELKAILKALNIAPIDLVRKKEKLWKENYSGTEMSDAEIIDVMIANPVLIERPIVVNGKRAAIGRPTGNITDLLAGD